MATKSNRRIQIQSGGGSLTAPKVGGSDNYLERLMYAQSKGMMDAQIKQQERGNISQDIATVQGQFGGVAPPGTTLNVGGVKAPINAKRSVEEAQSMSGADVINHHISKIKEMQGDPDIFRSSFQKATFKGLGKNKGQVMGMPLTYGDKNAIDLKFSMDDMSNRLLYLFSGKQINEQEFQRLSGALPSYIDISDPTDNSFSSLNNKLDTYKLGLDGIKNRLMEGGNYDSKYWEGPIAQTASASPTSGPSSPIPGMPGNKSPQQNNDIKTQYNQLRSQGMSAQDAKKQLGL